MDLSVRFVSFLDLSLRLVSSLDISLRLSLAWIYIWNSSLVCLKELSWICMWLWICLRFAWSWTSTWGLWWSCSALMTFERLEDIIFICNSYFSLAWIYWKSLFWVKATPWFQHCKIYSEVHSYYLDHKDIIDWLNFVLFIL